MASGSFRYLRIGVALVVALAFAVALWKVSAPMRDFTRGRAAARESRSADGLGAQPNARAEATRALRPTAPRPGAEQVADAGDEVAPDVPVEAAAPDEEWIDLALRFHSGSEKNAFLTALRARGGVVLGEIDALNAARVRVPSGAWLDRLYADVPAPIRRETNAPIRLPETPFNDVMAPPAASYVPFGDTLPVALGLDGSVSAFGRGVRIALIDTGIDPELGAVRRPDSGERWGEHGTAMASLILGNNAGVQGLAPGVTVLDFPVLRKDGSSDQFTVAQAVVQAVDAGAHVINISAGARNGAAILEDAIRYAFERGVVVVAAAGNDGSSGLSFPAAFSSSVAVGAVDAAGRHAYFSNRGERLDVAAPGIGVAAALPDGGSGLVSGTSASAAIVSAAIAALMSELGMSAMEAAAHLAAYGNDVAPPGKDDLTGAGIIHLGRAMEHRKPGIVDAAVITPRVDEDEQGNLSVVFGVQNRGTAPLARVDLSVEYGGASDTARVVDLDVGQSRGHTIRIPMSAVARQGVTLRCRAIVRGAADMRPGNNELTVVVPGDSK